jgi:hypothetical protein
MVKISVVRGFGILLGAFVVTTTACGPRVESVETAQQIERDEQAEVLVFVRDVDGIPQCPWEVLGTIEVEAGWRDDSRAVRDVKRAAARLGGPAVMAETARAESVRVLRFFDPMCNPLGEGYNP